jgi:hypothetical protein
MRQMARQYSTQSEARFIVEDRDGSQIYIYEEQETERMPFCINHGQEVFTRTLQALS